MMISPAANCVSYKSVKNARALMRRSPPAPLTMIIASSATAHTGHSAAGSANASEPPSVPTFRIAMCAMCGAAWVNSGACAATSAERSMSRCVVNAPMRSTVSVNLISRNSMSGEISISNAGSDSRMLSVAISVCPPAINLAASPCSASSAMACGTEVARWYSNAADFTGSVPQKILGLVLANQPTASP